MALVLVVVAVVSLVVFTLLQAPAPLPLPNPNGYDDFLKASALLTGDVGNASALDHDGLRALVSTNAEPLRLVRLGLSRSCSVPTDSAMTNIAGVLADLANLKSIARLLVEQGKLAEMENRNADASQSYVDTIRFGNEISRGGFVINRLVGVACEAMGDNALSKLVPKLNPDGARSVIAELEKIDSAGVTWDEVRRNENRFMHYQLRKAFNPVTWAMSRWATWRSRQRSEMKQKRLVAHLRLLTAELAARCYQADQGRAPTALAQLVPEYLRRVGVDPFSGRPLVYHPQGTNWLLYSVGDDRVDDGGKRVGRSAVLRGDIFYDSPL